MPTNGPPPKHSGPRPVSPPPPPTKPMRAVGITEGRCKGGQNPPLDPDAPRPPAPQGSGGRLGLAIEPPPDFLNGEHKRAFEALRRMCIAMRYTAPGFVMGWPGSTWPDGFEIVQSSNPPTTMISMRLDRFEEIVAALRSK